MANAKAVKRDNSTAYDIRGCPMYKCTACSKRYQTKRMVESHIRQKHGTSK